MSGCPKFSIPPDLSRDSVNHSPLRLTPPVPAEAKTNASVDSFAQPIPTWLQAVISTINLIILEIIKIILQKTNAATRYFFFRFSSLLHPPKPQNWQRIFQSTHTHLNCIRYIIIGPYRCFLLFSIDWPVAAKYRITQTAKTDITSPAETRWLEPGMYH